MRELLTDLDDWVSRGEHIALATLVRARGSSPRPAGSRLAVTRSGKMSGSVSGGCVETDVFERAMQVLDAGRPAVATYGITDEMGFRVGLTCGGAIDVLIEPFATDDSWRAVGRAVDEERPVALAVGLAPAALLGRRLVVTPGGELTGAIDAEIDRRLAEAGRDLLRNGGTRVLPVPWHGEEAAIYIEGIPPPPRLVIVGATHTAIALSRMAKGMGFRVIVVDPRGLFATAERFPEVDELRRAPPAEVLAGISGGDYTHLVVLTHDPKFDIPALEWALRSEVRYIGVMGSRRTHEQRRARLRQQGFTDAELAGIRAPVGLDLGGRTPEEMAVAILAEIIAVRHARDGRPLAEKDGAIHGGR